MSVTPVAFAPAASRVSRGGLRAAVCPARGGPRRLSRSVRPMKENRSRILMFRACTPRVVDETNDRLEGRISRFIEVGYAAHVLAWNDHKIRRHIQLQ